VLHEHKEVGTGKKRTMAAIGGRKTRGDGRAGGSAESKRRIMPEEKSS